MSLFSSLFAFARAALEFNKHTNTTNTPVKQPTAPCLWQVVLFEKLVFKALKVEGQRKVLCSAILLAKKTVVKTPKQKCIFPASQIQSLSVYLCASEPIKLTQSDTLYTFLLLQEILTVVFNSAPFPTV